MESFSAIVNSFQPLTIVAKLSILNFCGSWLHLSQASFFFTDICKQKKLNEFRCNILNAFPDDKHGLHNFTIDIELDICDETLYKCNIALVNTTSRVIFTDVLQMTYGRQNKSVHFINYYTNLTVFKEAENNLYTILVSRLWKNDLINFA